jgi:GT2 family glycosyltransferase
MPRLSIVIPVLGRHEVLDRVLGRLEEQTAPPTSFEVVVVSDPDDDPDDVAALAAGRPYRARAVVRPSPGVSAARNRGWREADGELILFLGADIAPVPALVWEHLSWHDRHPAEEVAVLGAVRWAPHLRVGPFMRWLEHGIQFGYQSFTGAKAGWGNFHTANVSMKKALLERSDGFDEDFPFLYEDLDLAYRLHREGLEVLYNPAAAGEHDHATTLEQYRPRIAEIAYAERRFVAKHPELEPYFHDRFAAVEGLDPGRGRARLLSFVPRDFPWLGRHVWWRIDAHYTRSLAPTYLTAWRSSDPGEG